MSSPAAPTALRHIAAATDFSPSAAEAARRAAQLAQAHNARLSLVHVVSHGWMDELRTWITDKTDWQDRLTTQTLQRLETEARQLDTAGAHPTQPVLIEGNPVQSLCDAVVGHDIDLLTVGARGSSPLHHLLVGTTADRLLHKLACPLLVVRQAAVHAYRRVLVPLDFSPWSAHALTLARRVAPEAQLMLLHSFRIPFEEKLRLAGVDDTTLVHYREKARTEARQRLQDFVLSSGLSAEQHSVCLTEGDAPPSILSQARERGCDLIVIGKHGRQAAEELLLGSVTKHVVSEAECDVLVSTARTP